MDRIFHVDVFKRVARTLSVVVRQQAQLSQLIIDSTALWR